MNKPVIASKVLTTLFLVITASAWAGIAQPSSSVVFSGFRDQNSVFQVDQQCKTQRPDLANTNSIANWEEWCYIITSQNNTSSEFTHFAVEVDPTQHMNDGSVQSSIASTMTVAPNNGDYDKDFTFGGPLNNLSGGRVQWNNQQDNVTGQGESALFCFSAPVIGSGTATVGLKVGGEKRSASLTAPNSGTATVATFEVLKDFSDDNPMDVEVHISCDNGLPLEQSHVISEGNGVTFVVKTFDNNQPMNCKIWETPVGGGYTGGYTASANGTATDEACFFDNIDTCGFAGQCTVSNTLKPVEVEVIKVWNFEDEVDIDETADIDIFCENIRLTPDGNLTNQSYNTTLDRSNLSHSEFPYPNFDAPVSRCRAVETIIDDAVESDGGCRDWITFAPGDGSVSCTITNTVFFEGVPTLNRYGLALMALLMLGLGVLGLRRFI